MLNNDFSLNSSKLLKKTDKDSKVLFLCSPNNPTGNSLETKEILNVLEDFNGIVVVDEAYIDFSSNESLIYSLRKYPNLVVLQTFSKAWGMAGIRLGMAYASTELIQVLNKIKYPYNLNILTQQKALKKIQEEKKNIDSVVANIIAERNKLSIELSGFNLVLKIYPSDANFLLIKVTNAKKIYNFLIEKEVIVRDRSNVDLCDNCLRITVGTSDENAELLKLLAEYDSITK